MRIAELEGRWLEFATLLPPEAPTSLALGGASLGGMALFAGEVHLRREGILLRDVAAVAWLEAPAEARVHLALTTYYLPVLLTTYYLLPTTY